MEKEIHKGDLIITKIIEPSTLKINDVIAFRDEENTVTTHRRNIARKLSIHTSAGITIYAIVNKLVTLEEINI